MMDAATALKPNPVGLSLFREIEFKGELSYITPDRAVKIDDTDVFEIKKTLVNRDFSRISIDLDEAVDLISKVGTIETSTIHKFKPYHNLLMELSSANGTRLLIIITSDDKYTYAKQFVQPEFNSNWYAEPFFIRFGLDGEGIDISYLAGVKKTDNLFHFESTVEEDVQYFIIMLASIFQAINSRYNNVSDSPKLSRKKAKGVRPLARNFYEYKTLVITPAFIDKTSRENSDKDRDAVRLHSRRAHYRRLASGKKVFVKSCTVGSPDNGVIDKDYLFKGHLHSQDAA